MLETESLSSLLWRCRSSIVNFASEIWNDKNIDQDTLLHLCWISRWLDEYTVAVHCLRQSKTPAVTIFSCLYICRGFGTEIIGITRTISWASCRCCNRCLTTSRGSPYWRSIHWANIANVQWHLWCRVEWWSFSSSPELQSDAFLAHRYRY